MQELFCRDGRGDPSDDIVSTEDGGDGHGGFIGNTPGRNSYLQKALFL